MFQTLVQFIMDTAMNKRSHSRVGRQINMLAEKDRQCGVAISLAWSGKGPLKVIFKQRLRGK